MQIWIATNNRDMPRVMKRKFPATVYGFWCGFKGGPHHTTSHFRSRLESQHQSVLGCAEECGDPLVQSGSWWQTLGVAAGLGARHTVKCLQILLTLIILFNIYHLFAHRLGFRRSATTLYPSNTAPPPTWTCWTTSFGHTLRTSLTWPLHNTKASLITTICRVFAELPPALVEKACSQFRIRIEAVIVVEGGYIE